MQVRRTIWLGLASVAVATWLTAASTPDVRPPALPDAPRPPAQLEQSAAVLQSEIARLHDRIGPTAMPEGRRDLFRFIGREPRRPAATRLDVDATPDETAAPIAAAPTPVLTLIGIAEDQSPAGPVRTAIVSGLGDLFLVKVGDSISGRFRVDAVLADSVALVDTSTSAETTLALR